MADPVGETCDAIDEDSVFHLRWNSHVESLQLLFETLLEQQLFVDVTLACEGGILRAHRVMLSACSTYFRRVLHETAAKHPLIIMRDVSFSEMDAILQFMYRGEIHVPESRLGSLLRTARLLEIRGLSDNLDKDGDVAESPQDPQQHRPAAKRKAGDQATAAADLNGSSWNCWPNNQTHTSLPSSVNGRNSQCKLKTQTKANDKDENHLTDSGDRQQQQQQYKRMKQSNAMDSQLPVADADNENGPSMDNSGVTGISDEENEVPHQESSPDADGCGESPSRIINAPPSPVPVLVKCEALEFSTVTPTAELEDGRSEEGDLETITVEQYPFSMLEDQTGAVVVQAVCPFCFKDCKRTAELRAHIRAHTGEKPFRCDICSAPFARSAHLKRHRRVHTGERPFECHRCQKTFSRQDKLKLHMDRHRLRDTGGKMIVGRPKKDNKKNNNTKNGNQDTASTSSTLSSSLPSPAAASTPTASGAELGMGQFAFPGAPARPGPAQSPMSSGLPSPGLPLAFSDINYFSLLSFSQRGLAMTQGDIPSSNVPHLLTPQALQELQLYRKTTSPRAATGAAGRGRSTAKSRFTRHSVSESASETLLNFAQQAGETAAAAAAASPPAQL